MLNTVLENSTYKNIYIYFKAGFLNIWYIFLTLQAIRVSFMPPWHVTQQKETQILGTIHMLKIEKGDETTETRWSKLLWRN